MRVEVAVLGRLSVRPNEPSGFRGAHHERAKSCYLFFFFYGVVPTRIRFLITPASALCLALWAKNWDQSLVCLSKYSVKVKVDKYVTNTKGQVKKKKSYCKLKKNADGAVVWWTRTPPTVDTHLSRAGRLTYHSLVLEPTVNVQKAVTSSSVFYSVILRPQRP